MRLFAFGCSFTNYLWPTWADIIGSEFEVYENWGQLGAGNPFIHNALVECSIVNKLTPEDTVMIMWSNMTRHDAYYDGGWHTGGNLLIEDNKHFGFDLRGFYVRDLSLIHSAKQMLDSIGCKYIMTSMVDIQTSDQFKNIDARSHVSDLLDFYKSTMDTIRPSVQATVFNGDWNNRPFRSLSQKFRLERVDPHPTPLEHLEYIDIVIPEFTISQSTRDWCMMIDHKVRADESINGLWKQKTVKRW